MPAPIALPLALRLLRRGEFPKKLGLCERWFSRALAPHGICWVRTAAGPVWKLDLANATHRWLVYGYYEGPGVWRWLARQKSARTIVDSGANIGQAVIHFAQVAPAARVLAYEPGASARAWLAGGVAANALGNVTISACGLGAESTTARLRDDGGREHHGAWNKVNDTEGEPITIVTLDAEIDRLGLDAIDFWKLDMEGYEGFALRGAGRALAAGKIRAIYIETAGESGRANLEFLTARGYRPHLVTPRGELAPWQLKHEYASALCLAPEAGAKSGIDR